MAKRKFGQLGGSFDPREDDARKKREEEEERRREQAYHDYVRATSAMGADRGALARKQEAQAWQRAYDRALDEAIYRARAKQNEDLMTFGQSKTPEIQPRTNQDLALETKARQYQALAHYRGLNDLTLGKQSRQPDQASMHDLIAGSMVDRAYEAKQREHRAEAYAATRPRQTIQAAPTTEINEWSSVDDLLKWNEEQQKTRVSAEQKEKEKADYIKWRDERDALIDRYVNAYERAEDQMKNESRAATPDSYLDAMQEWQEASKAVDAVGGIENLRKLQLEDAEKDRVYKAKLAGMDLDRMTFWDKAATALGGTLTGALKQYGASWLGQYQNAQSGNILNNVESDIDDALRLAAKQYLGSVSASSGRGSDYTQSLRDHIYTAAEAIGGADYAQRVMDYIDDQATKADPLMGFDLSTVKRNEDETYKKLFALTQSGTGKDLFDVETMINLQNNANTDLERAKNAMGELGGLGDFVVDAWSSAIQSGIDAALTAGLGLGGAGAVAMIPFGMRAAGGAWAEGAQKVQNRGEEIGRDMAKNLNRYAGQSGAIEMATELLWGSVGAESKVTGGGALDEYTTKKVVGALQRMSATETGAKILGRLGEKVVGGAFEGLEEVIADVANYLLDTAGIIGEEREALSLKAQITSFVTGAMSGLFGEVTGAVSGRMQNAQIGRDIRSELKAGDTSTLDDIAAAATQYKGDLQDTFNDIVDKRDIFLDSDSITFADQADKLTNADMGKLYQAFLEQTQGDDYDDIERAVKRLEKGKDLTERDVARIVRNEAVTDYLAERSGVEIGEESKTADAIEALKALASQREASEALRKAMSGKEDETAQKTLRERLRDVFFGSEETVAEETAEPTLKDRLNAREKALAEMEAEEEKRYRESATPPPIIRSESTSPLLTDKGVLEDSLRSSFAQNKDNRDVMSIAREAADNAQRDVTGARYSSYTRDSTFENAVYKKISPVEEALERTGVNKEAREEIIGLFNYNEQDPVEYASEQVRFWNQGNEGHDFDYEAAENPIVTMGQAHAAYIAGRENRIKNQEVNNDDRTAETGEVFVRGSGERYDGQDSYGQTPVLAEGAGGNQTGQAGHQQGRQTAPGLHNGVKVGARVTDTDLNAEGLTKAGYKVVTDIKGDKVATSVQKFADKHGVEVVMWRGGALDHDGSVERGFCYRNTDGTYTIGVQLDNERYAGDQLAIHEVVHKYIDMAKRGEAGGIELGDFFESGDLDHPATIRDHMIKKLGGRKAFENAVYAYAAAYADSNPDLFDKNGNLSEKVLQDIFEEMVCDAPAKMNAFEEKGWLEQKEKQRPAMEAAKTAVEELAINKTRGSPEEINRGNTARAQEDAFDSPVKTSIVIADAIAQRAMEVAGQKGADVKAVKAAHDNIRTLIDIVRPLMGKTDKNGMPLIPDETQYSNNIFANGSYGFDAEPTTECYRQMGYRALAKMVTDKLGRPLTNLEAIIVNQAAVEIAIDPPCLYCYSLLDRKAKENYKIQYVNERTWFEKKFEEDYGKNREALLKDINKQLDVSDPASYYSLYLNNGSGRTDNANKKARMKLWMEMWAKGIEGVSLKDVRNMEAEEITKADLSKIQDKTTRDYMKRSLKDLQDWVQASSQAKKYIPYTAYTNAGRGNLLNWKQNRIDLLNSEYGLRWYSHADYHPAFTIDNMQQVVDASILGLKGLMYCKPIAAAKIMAPTGMNINVSCFAQFKDGKYVSDDKLGANWDEVKALRDEYKNVGSVMVVTSDDMLLWALTQDWIDTVIPLHRVRSGSEFIQEFGLSDYTGQQSDKLNGQVAKDKYDEFLASYAKRVEDETGKKLTPAQMKSARDKMKAVYPAEHQNQYDKYIDICEERGITPRFDKIRQEILTGEYSYDGVQLTPEMYMKLVNETRQSESETKPLQPTFDMKAATEAVESLKSQGYFEYFKDASEWNGKRMTLKDWRDQVVKDIEAGKKPSELGYGRDLAVNEKGQYIVSRKQAQAEGLHGIHQGVKKSTVLDKDSSGRTLSKGQAEYFKDSKVRDKDGNLLVMYQGSAADFTVFDRKKSRGSNLYGRGFYFTADKNQAKIYGEAKPYYLNIEHPLSPGQHNISKAQMRKFLEAVFENDDEYSPENYGENATVDSVLKSVFGKGDFEMIQDVNATAIGDMVAAVELFNEVNGTEYDGLILETETVIFNSEQAKNIDNLNPTKDPDVRFSTLLDVRALKTVDWVGNTTSIKEQLIKHKTEIDTMPRFVSVTYNGERGAALKEIIMEQLQKIGGGIMKWGDITYEFDEEGAEKIISHISDDDELCAAAIAAPYVAKYGKLIAGQKNHDNHGTATLTFAAPVMINGIAVNEAVVIQFTKDGRPHAVNVYAETLDDFKQLKKVTRGTRKRTEKSSVYNLLTSDDLDKLKLSRRESAVKEKTKKSTVLSPNPARESLARKTFGLTGDFREAGYMLRSGSLLDFSGKRDGGPAHVRYMDHRDISEIFSKDELLSEATRSSSTPYMNAFISEGNIRLMDGQGVTIGEMEPTAQQYTVLKRFVDHVLRDEGYFYLDLSNNDGETVASREYYPADGSARIIRDIKEYFKNGELPYKSELSQFRYSTVLGDSDLVAANRQLRKDISELRSKLKTRTAQKEYWKGQTKTTDGRRARLDDAKKLARTLAKEHGSKIDVDVVGAKLKDLADFCLNEREFDDAFYEEARMRTYEIAHMILDDSEILRDEKDPASYSKLRDYLKSTKLYVPASMQRDLSEDYAAYRKSLAGTVTLTTSDTSATGIDVAYKELQEIFGKGLFPDINHPADQFKRIMEILESFKPVYERMNSYEMAEAVEWTANDILGRVVGEEIRQTDPTYADKMEARLKAEREKAKAALKLVRQKRDQQVEALKQHYRQVAEDKRAKRIDSEARTRLLNIARRLNNKKLDRATRALLDKYIGDLDLVSKGLTGKSIHDLQGLQTWYEAYKDKMGEDFIPIKSIEDRLKRLSQKHIKDMTQEEVADLTTILLHLENEIRTASKLIESQEKRDIYAAGMEVIDDIRGTRGKKGTLGKYIVTETLTPVREIRRLTGYREHDPLYTATKELADGQRKMLDYQRRAEALVKKWTEDKAFVKRIAGKNAQEITVQGLVNGELTEVKITPAMRMALYLHGKNDGNMKHISKGGVKIPDMTLYKKGKMQEAYDQGTRVVFTRGMINKIASQMAEDERAFADTVSWYYNNMSRGEINETSELLKGFSIAGVDYYYPIDTDGNFLKKEFDAIKRDGSIEGMGFLKERIDNPTNPIMLYDMNDTLNKSISQHSKYVGLAIPVRNFNKLYGVSTFSEREVDYEADPFDRQDWQYDTSVAETIRKQWGAEAAKYIEKMMTDIQNGTGLDRDVWGSALAKARSKYAGAVLNTNASVAFKQTASYPTAAAVVGYAPLMKALKNSNRRVDLEKVEKLTALLWYRMKGFSNVELGDIGKGKHQIPKALNWIQAMDVWTTRKLWLAAEYYVETNNKDLKRGTEAFDLATAEVYNRIIEETQPNYTMMQRPQILRSESDLTRALNMFKTQPFQNFNILYDAIGNLRAQERYYKANATEENLKALKEARKGAARAISSQIISAFVFSLMQFAWDAFRGKTKKYKDDDEDEMTLLSWLKGMGINVLSSVGGMIPFGGYALELGESMVDGIVKALGGDPFFNQTFYGMSENASESMNDMGKAVLSITSQIAELFAGNKIDESAIRKFVDSASDIAQFAGVPVSNWIKLAQATAQNVFKAADGEYLGGYKALRVTTDPAKYKSDYYALLKKAWMNDPEAFTEIRQNMINMAGDPFATSSKTAGENIDAKVKEWQKEQAKKESFYQITAGNIQSSSVWQQAGEKQRKTTMDALLALSAGQDDATWAKIDAGESVGLDATEYLLYNLALSVADANGGSHTNADYEKAIRMVDGLTDEERSYLWHLHTDSDKNNPWAAPAITRGGNGDRNMAVTDVAADLGMLVSKKPSWYAGNWRKPATEQAPDVVKRGEGINPYGTSMHGEPTQARREFEQTLGGDVYRKLWAMASDQNAIYDVYDTMEYIAKDRQAQLYQEKQPGYVPEGYKTDTPAERLTAALAYMPELETDPAKAAVLQKLYEILADGVENGDLSRKDSELNKLLWKLGF